MSGAVVLIMFLAALLTAARLFLRPEHRPPIPTRKEAEGDPSWGASLEGDDRACMRRSKSTGASRTMDFRDQAGCDDD